MVTRSEGRKGQSAMTEPMILDPEVIKSLRELKDGPEDPIMQELVDMYFADAPVQIEAIQAALSLSDAAAVARAAHALKSSSGNLGASELHGRLADLEVAARGGDLSHAEDSVAQIISAFERVRAALMIERDRP
jgi:HPt (histidine-containing phosphotransfer) domain-containing protein